MDNQRMIKQLLLNESLFFFTTATLNFSTDLNKSFFSRGTTEKFNF